VVTCWLVLAAPASAQPRRDDDRSRTREEINLMDPKDPASPFHAVFTNPFHWVTVVAFFAIGFFYFTAPMMGYLSMRRGFLAAAMWLMLAKILIIVTRVTIYYFYFTIVFNKPPIDPSDITKRSFMLITLPMVFSLVEMVLFLLASL